MEEGMGVVRECCVMLCFSDVSPQGLLITCSLFATWQQSSVSCSAKWAVFPSVGSDLCVTE